MTNDSFDLLSKKLVDTYVGWVPPQIMESRVEGRLIRRQQIIAPNRFTLILRHITAPTQHLCGYVHVDQALMNEFRDGHDITYYGPGTRDISWRWFNSQRKLVTAAKVSPGDAADYWVGMDFSPDATEAGVIERVNALESFVNTIREFSP